MSILGSSLFYTNTAPFATGNKRTANDVLRLTMSVISYVLDAASDR